MAFSGEIPVQMPGIHDTTSQDNQLFVQGRTLPFLAMLWR